MGGFSNTGYQEVIDYFYKAKKYTTNQKAIRTFDGFYVFIAYSK